MLSLLLRQFPIFLLLSLGHSVYAQCGLTVNAGPDRLVCSSGDLANLQGSVSGPNFLNASWSPTTGLSNPNSLSPTATVTGPMTYTLSGFRFDPSTNEITNGDFSAGATGFTTEYDPGSGGAFGLLSDEGEYVISSNTSLTHSNFASCTDHTGGGDMMVVNGATTPGEAVWCQMVTVLPGRDYAFSAWLMSAIAQNPARLQFSVNGNLLGNTFRASNAVCIWNEFNEVWNSGAETSAEICIVNQNTGGSGNDFALDDLFFGEVCEQTDEVTVDFITVDAVAPATVPLPCNAGPLGFQIDGSGSSSGPEYFYNWTTVDGNILFDQNTASPTVNQAGTYLLTVTYDDGLAFCIDQATVVVTEDPDIPEAFAESLGDISCTTPTTRLTAVGSTSGGGIDYQWSTTDGFIASGETSGGPIVNSSGTYTLLVTHRASGCTASASVTVTEDRREPVVAIATPGMLDCSGRSIQLNASNSEAARNITATWSTSGGNFVAGTNGLRPVVNAPGAYTLTLTNTDNGCTVDSTVIVSQRMSNLTVNVPRADIITCLQPQVDLTGLVGNGTNYTYAWSTSNGNFTSGTSAATATVDSAGLYILAVTDGGTGCTLRDTVRVIANNANPDIAIQSARPFTCVRAQQTLNTSGSSLGPDFNYRWTTADGSILSDTFGPSPTVTEAGVYTLRITNATNGCFADSSLRISENLSTPVANAGTGFILTCDTSQDTLDGRNSTQSLTLEYDWSTANGNILADTNTLRPVIGAPGNYILTVTDTLNGCASKDTVMIGQDDNIPTATIAPPSQLNCDNTTLGLDATGSDFGPGFTLSWSTTDGNILSGDAGLTPRIDAPGTYTLRIENTTNSCPNERRVTVRQNVVPPVAEAGPAFVLTCANDTLPLLSQGTTLGDSLDYQWTTANGFFVDNTRLVGPRIYRAGRYQLTVRNRNNGCSATDSVDISEDFLPPPIDLSPSLREVTCRDSFQLLNEGYVDDPRFSYRWLREGAVNLPGDTFPQLRVNSQGIYVLNIVNNENGCGVIDAVVISENNTPPQVEIAPAEPLDCDRDMLMLDATASDAGLSASWSSDAPIVSGAAGLQPTVADPGTYTLRLTNPANGCTTIDSITVRQDITAPVAEAGLPFTLNCFQPEQSLDLLGSSGGDSITYRWVTTDGSLAGDPTSAGPIATGPGRYLLTVRNQNNGCTAVDSVDVAEDKTNPTANAGQDRTLTCRDTIVSLGAAAGAMNGWQYRWVAVSGTVTDSTYLPTRSVSQVGTYELRVLNPNNGCSVTDRVMVTEDRQLPVTAIAPVRPLNCSVRERTLSVAPPPPGQNYRSQWRTDDGLLLSSAEVLEPTVGQGGTYLLLLENLANACVDSFSITVAQDTVSPGLSLPIPPPLDCDRLSLELQPEITGPTDNLRYTWTTTEGGNFLSGTSSRLASIDAPGTYRLDVFNEVNNCSGTVTTTVVQDAVPPELSAPATLPLTCVDTVRQLLVEVANDPGNLVVSWNTDSGNFLSGIGSFQPAVDQPGDYLITVLNEENDCSSELTLTVVRDITPPVVNAGIDFDLGCTTDPQRLSATATGTGPFAYAWTTANGTLLADLSTPTPLINTPGTYRLEVTDAANGCTATDAILTTQSLLESFDFTQTVPDCREPTGSVFFTEVIGGTDPFIYSVDGGQNFTAAEEALNLPPGRYGLVVQDANGCELTRTVTVPNAPELTLALPSRFVIELGEDLQLNPQTNFADDRFVVIDWSPASELSCNDCLRPVATPTDSRTYVLYLESSDGCTATDSIRLTLDKRREVFFPTAFSPNGDGINDFYLPLADPKLVREISDFSIYDRWGNAVFEIATTPPNQTTSGWDGRHQGRPMNPAVFVYTATVTFLDGEQRNFKGEFSLLR